MLSNTILIVTLSVSTDSPSLWNAQFFTQDAQSQVFQAQQLEESTNNTYERGRPFESATPYEVTPTFEIPLPLVDLTPPQGINPFINKDSVYSDSDDDDANVSKTNDMNEDVGHGSNNEDDNENALLSDYASRDDEAGLCLDSSNDDAMAKMSVDMQKLLYKPSDRLFHPKVNMYFKNMKEYTTTLKGYTIRGGFRMRRNKFERKRVSV